MLDIKQLAKELGLCEKTIRNHIKSGKIKAVRIGNVWRISEEEVKRIKEGVDERVNYLFWKAK